MLSLTASESTAARRLSGGAIRPEAEKRLIGPLFMAALPLPRRGGDSESPQLSMAA